MPPDKRKFTPSDFYRIQWTYKEQISTSPVADSPQTSDSHHNDKDSLPDLLQRISEGTKDEKVRKAISAFHHDQGEEHLSGEEPRTSQLEESKHLDGNQLGCNLSRGESNGKSPVDNEEISKTDTRREKARKTRRNAITKFEEIRRKAISASHQDQTEEQLSGEEPRSPQHAEAKHHDRNQSVRNTSNEGSASTSPVDIEESSNTGTRTEKASKTRRIRHRLSCHH
jgi:hypothetical protein